MYSHFTSEKTVNCETGLDVMGNTVHIGDPIIFVGSNGYLVKGKVTDICKEELDEDSMKYAVQYRLVDAVKNIPTKWYYKIDTDKKRHTEKSWTDVIKIVSEN